MKLSTTSLMSIGALGNGFYHLKNFQILRGVKKVGFNLSKVEAHFFTQTHLFLQKKEKNYVFYLAMC